MTTLERLRRHSRVELVDDERREGNGVIVTLRKGWSFDPKQDNRVAGEDTPYKAMQLVRSARDFHGPFTA